VLREILTLPLDLVTVTATALALRQGHRRRRGGQTLQDAAHLLIAGYDGSGIIRGDQFYDDFVALYKLDALPIMPDDS